MLHEISGDREMPRRTVLTSGFAAAVRPIAATAVATDDSGLKVSEILIPTADGEIPGYSARPAEGSHFPIVVVVHEIFGVHEHIKDVCRRFAKAGYLAVAPELFVRQGDVSGIADFTELIKIVSQAPDAQVLSDIDSTVKFAVENNDSDPSRLAIIGFCWGGRVTWLYAAHSAELKAGAAFYGKLVGQNSELQPKFPVDVVKDLKAPVMGMYGGQDQGIPLDAVETMEALLKDADSKSFINVYPDAGHAFFADYRPSYNAEAAGDAWNKVLTFFAEQGV
jgi:carboxymethylenebutenolidase